jgi:hypothetical protein
MISRFFGYFFGINENVSSHNLKTDTVKSNEITILNSIRESIAKTIRVSSDWDDAEGYYMYNHKNVSEYKKSLNLIVNQIETELKVNPDLCRVWIDDYGTKKVMCHLNGRLHHIYLDRYHIDWVENEFSRGNGCTTFDFL